MVINYFMWQDAMIGHVWRYSVSWYRDPALLDNIIIVRSRPRDVKRKLDITSWTNYGYTGHTSPVVLYVQVSSNYKSNYLSVQILTMV